MAIGATPETRCPRSERASERGEFMERAGENPQEDEIAMRWEELPRDLVSSILPWLPVTAILRSHTVCKRFHEWLSSLSFLEEYARVPARSSWLLLFPSSRPSIACAYDPSLDVWLELPNAFLPLETHPLASSRGLICGAPKPDRGGSDEFFYVSNPVTRSWVAVPRPRELSACFFLVVGMVSTGSSSFQIVVVGSEIAHDDSFKLSAWVFESSAWAWSEGGSSTSIGAAISTSKAMIGAKLFVISGNRELVAYDLAHARWSRVSFPSRGVTSAKLVDRLGKLVLVARTAQDDDIRLWELQEDLQREIEISSEVAGNWRELDRMPRCHSEKLLAAPSASRRFACIGSGDFAFFSSSKCPSILVYTFSTRCWRWTSGCARVSRNPHYDLLLGICLEPRLETRPSNPQSKTCSSRDELGKRRALL